MKSATVLQTAPNYYEDLYSQVYIWSIDAFACLGVWARHWECTQRQYGHAEAAPDGTTVYQKGLATHIHHMQGIT